MRTNLCVEICHLFLSEVILLQIRICGNSREAPSASIVARIEFLHCKYIPDFVPLACFVLVEFERSGGEVVFRRTSEAKIQSKGRESSELQ